MTLEQLRIFVAVATREHVTQGARELNLTQSATSAAISNLEARYNTRLFDRIGRRVKLTEAGRIFLPEAKAVLTRAAAAEAILSDLTGLKRGSLRVAASQTVANYWLPPKLAQFYRRYPGVAVDVTIGNTETTALFVREGLGDIGIVEGTVDDHCLDVSSVAEDELVLITAPAHPLATQTGIRPDDLKQCAWIVREAGSGTRAVLERVLANASIRMQQLDVAFTLPSNESIRAAVEAGSGIAVMSRLVVEKSIESGTLARIDFDLPKRQFYMLRHKERFVTRANLELCKLLRGP